jgi:HAMP domain-containing protein
MSKTLSVVLVVGLLVIAAITGYSLVAAVQNATRPIANTGNVVETQVANILPPTPTPLPNGQAVVLSIRSLNRLESAQSVIEKVIIKENGQGALGALFGDRVIFVAHGEVIAGIDLAKMQEGDVQVLPSGKAYVVLPAPEIFVTNIDNQKSYVVDRQTGSPKVM